MTNITEDVINIPCIPTAVDYRSHEIIQITNTEGYPGLPTGIDVDKSLEHVKSTVEFEMNTAEESVASSSSNNNIKISSGEPTVSTSAITDKETSKPRKRRTKK